jgi:hypothetical protein
MDRASNSSAEKQSVLNFDQTDTCSRLCSEALDTLPRADKPADKPTPEEQKKELLGKKATDMADKLKDGKPSEDDMFDATELAHQAHVLGVTKDFETAVNAKLDAAHAQCKFSIKDENLIPGLYQIKTTLSDKTSGKELASNESIFADNEWDPTKTFQKQAKESKHMPPYAIPETPRSK